MPTVRTQPAGTKLVICVWHPFTFWRPQPVLPKTLRRRWPEMSVLHLPDYDHLSQELPDTDIFVGYSLRPQQLELAKKLKWLHSTAAGVAQLMYPELRDSGILVTNPSGIFSIPMAEHTMGLLIALARNFPDSVRYQDKSHWAQQDLWDQPQRLTELNGQLLLIVGYGSIGRELARRAHAFEIRVWGVTRSGKGDATYAEKIVAASQLDEVLPQADYVVVAAPETHETAQLMSAPRIAKMKRGARLINVGRGSLLDEAALRRALESGALAGAAVDVAGTEPLPPESPLWKAPNLFITPHTSAVSDHLWVRQADTLVQLLERWFDGRELFNQVDFNRGY
ncbi:MAG TPA: D-2-hydroxyacid dehydrogenase [Candidatus Acidoferrum sp.]|nr:D-2-hydroxyacid dehydrogenase [Candidatus Acidoferrum sp.]